MTLAFLERSPAALRLTPSVAPDVGTGALHVRLPLPLPPGVPPGAPDLGLVYGTSPASSIVGVGWSLTLPAAVTVGPARGVPSWTGRDGLLFGGEELLPWIEPDGSPRAHVQDGIAIQVYRLATNPDDLRVERHFDTTTGAVTWWSRDGGNVLTRYGDTETARVFDPADASRIAAWLPTFRVDPVGRAIELEYVEEDLRGVDRAAACERGRLRMTQAQRYIKTIRFGNREPADPDGPAPGTTWNFALVFDYGDHDPDDPQLVPDRDWAVRPDPSSSYRPGFDVRTWRRCEAVHVFQRIGDSYERVSTTRFIYADPSSSVVSRLVKVQHTAWRDAGSRSASLPPVRFRYATPGVDPYIGPRIQTPASRQGLANTRTRWIDLHGDGLPGVLTEASSGWWYSRNLGSGHFAAPVALAERPSTRLTAMALGDEDQDGNTDLATLVGRGAGRYQLDREQQAWSGYKARSRTARVEGITPRVQRVDLDGDGRPDLVISETDYFLWYPSDAPEGLGEPRRIPKPRRAGMARELRPDPLLDLLFADMNGDGLPGLVHIENGRVEYWPNLGNGRFGEAVVMDDAPTFTRRDTFDIRRLRLADLTGNGCPDLLYLDGDELRWWYNLGGNRLRFGGVRRGVPSLDGLTDLRVLEIYGDGRPALVWSSAAPTAQGLAALPLTGEVQPGRLVEIDNATTTFRYRDGYLDSDAREFRGFGCVDQFDIEVTTDDPLAPTSIPRLTRTWRIVGAADELRTSCARSWEGGPISGAPRVAGLENPSLDPIRARRAVAGRPRRVEVFAAPGGIANTVPLEVRTWTWEVQPVGGAVTPKYRPVRVVERDQVQAIHEGEATDPRITRNLTVGLDDTGYPILVARVAHARQSPDAPGQEAGGIELHASRIVHVDTNDRFERAIPVENRTLELLGLDPSTVDRGRLLASDVNAALSSPMPHHAISGGGIETRLWSWERSYYYDNNRTSVLPLGQVGTRTFVHHEMTAVFDAAWPESIYGGRVDDARLLAEGYRKKDGYWWRDDPVHIWGTDAEFAPLVATIRPDGTGPQLEYDDQLPVSSTDAVGNRTEATIDPYTRAPWKLTDPNGLVQEVEYDPFGVVIRHVHYGTVTENDITHPWGGEPLSPAVPRTLDEALVDPEAALGTCDTATWIDLEAAEKDELPARILTLQRTRLLQDGAGNENAPDVRIQLAYLDGAGELLQTRLRVEPGNAVQRTVENVVIVDDVGVPILGPTTDRWLVSGFEVKNRKGEVVRLHEAYFSTGPAFEADEPLLRLGVSTALTYDALGRVARVDHPDGSLERNEYSAWSIRRFDRNDTAEGSAWGIMRGLEAPGSPGAEALDRVRDHTNTPNVVDLDPWGREVRVTTAGGTVTDDRVNRVVFDGGGRGTQVIDARGLVASLEELSLDGEVVYQRSIDAGETWLLSDAFGRPRHRWDALGHHVETTFDVADRPLQELVRGNGLNHQVSTYTYGETVGDGATRNALGRIVEIRDGSGFQEILRYDPLGAPLASERQLREDVEGEPDWRLPVALSLERFASRTIYDALGRLVRATLPDGLLREVGWTISGKMRSIALTASDGTLVRTEIFANADYDADGRRLSRLLGNGVNQDWSYESDTRRLARQRARLDGSTLQDLRISYDPMGNVLRIVDLVQEPGFSGALLHGLNTSAATTYRYDPHYRLIEARGRVHRALLRSDNGPNSGSYRFSRQVSLNDASQVERYTRTYVYDPADNLLQMRHLGVSSQWTTKMWVSPTSNRSQPKHDLAGNPVIDPESRFDSAGQLVELDHLRRVDWSWRGTLSRAVLIDRSESGDPDDVEHYTYGADRMRVRKVHSRLANGTIETTETIYFAGCELRRVRLGNEPILERWTSQVHDEEGRVALVHRWTRDDLGRESDDLSRARIHYSLGNHQGSAVVELNETGTLIAYEEYFPYGGTSFIAGDNKRAIALRDYRYMGKERDAATGLQYFGHRYYAPWLQRWVNPDPAGLVDGTNLFCFVRGNPSTLIDRTGLESNIQEQDWEILATVKGAGTWTEKRALQYFNATVGRKLGIRALDLELHDGNWYIIDQESVDPGAAGREAAQNIIDIMESSPAGLGESGDNDPYKSSEKIGSNAAESISSLPVDASEASQGEGDESQSGFGNNGRGSKGSGPGGGGVSAGSDNTEDVPGNGSGIGKGARTKRGRGDGSSTTPGSGSKGKDASGDKNSNGRAKASGGRPGGKRLTGKPGGSPNGTPGGGQVPVGDRTKGHTRVSQDVPGGSGDLSAPPGAGPGGLDPHGNTSASPSSPSTDGSPHGNPSGTPAGSPNGDAGSTGTENGQEPRTWFDDVVCAVGYLNFESCSGDEGGERYGVPGGWLDWIPANRFTQSLYVALGGVNAVLTAVSLVTGVGEVALALKAGLATLWRIGLRASAKALWSKSISFGRGMMSHGRELVAGVSSQAHSLATRVWSWFRRGRGLTNSGDELVTIYRGVNSSHVHFALQSSGVVKPNNRWWQFWKGRGSSPYQHNAGETFNSPFTSWTTDPRVAENFARRPGGPGVVIQARVAASRLIESPNMKEVSLIQGGGGVSEAEVLIRGTLRGVVKWFR